MLDIKSEILKKREKENIKVELFNSVVEENMEQIKEIIGYSNLTMKCYKEHDLLKIDIFTEDKKTKYYFNYNSIKRYLYINSDDTLDKEMIESKLKDFIVHIAEKEDIRINEDNKPIRGLSKKELILKDWQKEIVNDKSKIIMANISRGGSKTFLLANKVLEDKPKVAVYINSNPNAGLRYFRDHFVEIFKLDEDINNTVMNHHLSNGQLVIRFNNGERIVIYNQETIPKDIEIDMVLFDDGLPQLDIKANQYVSVFTIKYPIMNFFNCRKDISYHVIGIKQLIESGYLTKEQIQNTKERLGELDFDKIFDICNEYKELFEEEKLSRGKRREANLYEESAGDFSGNGKLRFNERIGYNFATREIVKGEFKKLIKNNADEIKDIFKSFENVKVEIQDSIITICDNFGIIDQLSLCDVLNNIKESPSELLLDFVANTFLKLNYGLVK